MRLVVTDLEGRRIGWGRANLRFFAKLLPAILHDIVLFGAELLSSGVILLPVAILLSSAIWLLSYLMAAFTPRRQALHDLIARTLVLQR